MPVLRVNDYDMAYVEAGKGAPVVLVHGTLSDYRYWGLQMAALGKAHRVIAVSLRRHYPERWDGIGTGDMAAEHIADLGAFIAALGAGPVHLLGHSRGGYVAFGAARRWPHLLQSLILADPGGELEASLAGGAAPARDDLVADSGAAAPADLRAATDDVLSRLSPREAEILRRSFGQAGEQTLEEVGRRYKETRERIRQIEAKAMQKLAPGRHGGAPASGALTLIRDCADLVKSGDVEGALRRFCETVIGPGGWDKVPEPGKAMMRDNAATLIGQARERREPFSAAAMREIKNPTLLINGARSAPFFHAIADAMLKHIAGARRVMIEGAGHAMNVEQPGAFNAALLDFLATR